MIIDEKSKRNGTVLVVDDEQRILRFLSLSLKASGYRVVTAETGEKALDLARQDKPDIVVLDVFLPGIDGFEVLRQLRTFSQAPVIMISARDSLGPNAMDQGAADFLAKPFKPEQLVQRIKGILGK
jgi:two-component system KDP operon response regulator KdpE